MNNKILIQFKSIFTFSLLIICLSSSSILYAADNYEISCKGNLTTNSTKNFAFQMSSYEYYEILANDLIDGELDTVNGTVEFYDSDSAICGGSKNENILIEGFCDYDTDSCWDVKVGKGGEEVIYYDEENSLFANNTIVINNYHPCLPNNTSTFTSGLYSGSAPYSNHDIPYLHANLNRYNILKTEYLSQSVADVYRKICKADVPTDDPNSNDYHDELNQLIDNTSENKNITEINEREKKLDIDLETYVSNYNNNDTTETDLSDFSSTYETTLDTTFQSYTDVFGFGSYGVAPTPISFTMFSKTYELFNITIIDEYLEFIRNTFAIFAYLWGIIIVFRGV